MNQRVLLSTSLCAPTSEGAPTFPSSYLSNGKSSRSKGSNVGRSRIGKVRGVRKSWEATQTRELEEEKEVKRN